MLQASDLARLSSFSRNFMASDTLLVGNGP